MPTIMHNCYTDCTEICKLCVLYNNFNLSDFNQYIYMISIRLESCKLISCFSNLMCCINFTDAHIR